MHLRTKQQTTLTRSHKMTKVFTVIAMVLTVTSAANASYVCSVSAENPNQPGVYDQTLKTYEGEIENNQSVFIYDNGNTLVTAMVSKKGSLQLASFQKGTTKIDALASAKTDALALIDGKNGFAVACYKK